MDTIVFLGIQGSGKGTQALLLSERIGFRHVNIGDLFRAQIASDTSIGREVSSIIEAGRLVSNHLVYKLIKASISPDLKGVVFDGFPRTVGQARYLSHHYNLRDVIYLDLAEDVAIKRMSSRLTCSECSTTFNLLSKPPQKEGICDECGGKLVLRKDDSPEAIKQRFEEFREQTFPLIEYFESRELLRRITANGSIEEVEAEIAGKIFLA